MNTIEESGKVDMPQREKKVVYTAKTHTTGGGRDGGTSRSSDGRLEVKFSIPGTPGNGTNPEQMLAAGYVNRSLPDKELDGFVDALASRISSFDKQAIAETKHLANIASLPSDADIAPEWDDFIASLQRPAAQARIKKLMEQGFHKPGAVESRLGYYVGQLGT